MFSVLHYNFISSRNINDEEFRVLSAILLRVKVNGDSSVFYQDIARVTGKPVKELVKIVSNLVSKEIVSEVSRKGDMITKININYFQPIKGKKEEVFRFNPSGE